jgi:hypothetical protein
MNELVVAERAMQWHKLTALVLDSVSSPITRRVYNLALHEFIAWHTEAPRPATKSRPPVFWPASKTLTCSLTKPALWCFERCRRPARRPWKSRQLAEPLVCSWHVMPPARRGDSSINDKYAFHDRDKKFCSRCIRFNLR